MEMLGLSFRFRCESGAINDRQLGLSFRFRYESRAISDRQLGHSFRLRYESGAINDRQLGHIFHFALLLNGTLHRMPSEFRRASVIYVMV